MPTEQQLGGVDLHYEQAGSGDDLLLLCGLGDDHTAWDAQVAGFQNRFRITVVDNRGVGQSSLPDGEFRVHDMARDAAALLDRLGIASARVAGFSMGGAIAQELALSRPDLVRSLVLVGTWARGDRFVNTVLASWAWLAGVADSDRAFIDAFLPWVYAPALYEDGRIDEITETMLANPHPQGTEAFQRTARACIAHDALDRLGAIAAPTLVISGELDLILPPRFSRQLADRIPGARLVELAGRAHQPFQEEPEEFNAIVGPFWAEAG
jgi:pimeloyl-ACP methyl ester carboxylesterase